MNIKTFNHLLGFKFSPFFNFKLFFFPMYLFAPYLADFGHYQTVFRLHIGLEMCPYINVHCPFFAQWRILIMLTISENFSCVQLCAVRFLDIFPVTPISPPQRQDMHRCMFWIFIFLVITQGISWYTFYFDPLKFFV